MKTMPDKIASAATYATSGGLIAGGLGGWFEWFHGLDWNFIGLFSGVFLGIATFAVNAYYKRRDNQRQEKADRDYAEQQRIRTDALTSYLSNSPRHDELKAPEVVEAVDNAFRIAEKP